VIVVESPQDILERTDAPPPAGAASGPLVPQVGVLALVPDFWDSPWMVRHHVLTRLADYFHVVWVDPARSWREVWLGHGRPSASAGANPPRRPGFSIYTPGRLLPDVYRPRKVGLALQHRRLHQAAAILRSRGCRRVVLYLWRPQFAAAVDWLDHHAIVYHIDDEYTFSATEQPVDPAEEALMRRADCVLIQSPELLAKKGRYNANTHRVPVGVDFAAYAQPRPEPADLAGIPRPRIGYIGLMKGQLDFPLLTAVARRRSGWSFVFIGPPNANLGRHAAEFAELRKLPNVCLLGHRALRDLPAYTQHMDALTLGYRRNDYTRFITPLKLQEYLASGRPVVGTPIPFLRQFADVVALAETPEAFADALDEALGSRANSPEAVRDRQAVAGARDWDHVVRYIAGALADSVGVRVKLPDPPPGWHDSVSEACRYVPDGG
jgi:glycosyltransferase involved in cell wall biosynthesis